MLALTSRSAVGELFAVLLTIDLHDHRKESF